MRLRFLQVRLHGMQAISWGTFTWCNNTMQNGDQNAVTNAIEDNAEARTVNRQAMKEDQLSVGRADWRSFDSKGKPTI